MEIEQNVSLKIFLSEVDEKATKNSPFRTLVEAFVCNGCVVINFSYPISSIVVAVTSVSTGKALCWEVYKMPGNIVINMMEESTGDYDLKLTSPQGCLHGIFSISNDELSFSQQK